MSVREGLIRDERGNAVAKKSFAGLCVTGHRSTNALCFGRELDLNHQRLPFPRIRRVSELIRDFNTDQFIVDLFNTMLPTV